MPGGGKFSEKSMTKHQIHFALIIPGLQNAGMLPVPQYLFREFERIGGHAWHVGLQIASKRADDLLAQKCHLMASFTGIGMKIPAERIESLPQHLPPC
ncbi:hypothetical protein U14_03367 [Candidatus Moduliflexus flocculans]|uniref:Uncharacterized protein n=1 Tax=Candidatus Moduliflexus flocculans TaxID=1499966 RepID=A0A081BP01_9BACT|nr:hypothetical protein U14_03367 [Candidatus Moduliflexus flocculans]